MSSGNRFFIRRNTLDSDMFELYNNSKPFSPLPKYLVCIIHTDMLSDMLAENDPDFKSMVLGMGPQDQFEIGLEIKEL